MSKIKYTPVSKGVMCCMKKFIPEKQEKVVVSIRISEKLLETVDAKANEVQISRNEFIKQCITFALSNMDGNDENPS